MATCGLERSIQQPISNGCSSSLILPKTVSTPAPSDCYIEREYFIRSLVFGADGTGKHALIASNFLRDNKNLPTYTRKDVDFIPKKLMRPYTTIKYHFWTFRINNKSLTTEVLWRAYYKSASAFIFVYDITNADSFKRLEQAVQSVLSVIPQKEFYGILIGNKEDLDNKREVTCEEALAFKEKYGLTEFFETNEQAEKETPQFLEKLEPRLKLTYESI